MRVYRDEKVCFIGGVVNIDNSTVITINDNTWNYINFYYRPSLDTNQYNILKYKDYTTVYDGSARSMAATCNL